MKKNNKLWLGILLLLVIAATSKLSAQTISGLANITVTEGNSTPVFIGPNAVVSGGSSYGGGYLLFDLEDGDQIGFVSNTNPNATGAISYSGTTVYLGNGSGKDVIGSIDGVLNGQNGLDLKINFTAEFSNSSFENGIGGWTIGQQMVDLGVTSIAGFTTPNDNTYPANSGGDGDAPYSGASYNYEITNSQYTNGSQSLRLFSNMTTSHGCDIVHGPYVYSDVFQSVANDVISFDWRAFAGSDAYDVFGYIQNINTGAQTIVLDANGGSYGFNTNWATASVTIPATGSYRFVFVSGTYDATCGQAAGASLYIDNVRVYGNLVNDAVVADIIKTITYQNVCGSSAATRNLTVTASNNSGQSGSAYSTISFITTPPVAICKSGVTVTLDANGEATVLGSDLDNGSTDGCPITLVPSKSLFTCNDIGTNQVLLNVYDSYGSLATCTSSVTVQYTPFAPNVTTTAPSNITATSATAGGTVSNNCETTTARGICWNTTGNPSLSDNFTTDGTGAGTYTSSITGLSLGTTYYVRAYATNLVGTTYGAEYSFVAHIPYCTPAVSSTPCYYMWITNVSTSGGITNFNNSTGCASSSYTDYSSSHSVSQAQGSAVNMSFSSYGYAMHYAVWVDFDDNGTFSSSERVIAYANSYYGMTVNTSFIVPTNAPSGAHKMRIRADYYGNSMPNDACAAVYYGETEDYELVVSGGAPQITCPADITVNSDASQCGAVVTFNATATGTPTPTLTYSPASGSLIPLGTTTVTATASNGSGSTSCTFDVTVVDNTPPTVITQNAIVYLDANGQASVSPSMVDNGSNDNCTIASMTVTPTTFDCSDFGANTVTLTVFDGSGNYSTGTAVVTVSGTDTDGDNIPDLCDADDDNDGITDALECNQSNFYWSSPPSISGYVATGTINGIGYTYTSSSPVTATSYMFANSVFPSSYNVPNSNPTIQNIYVTNNTLSFASPMTNPVLVFASIGQAGLQVPITFSAPIQVVWSQNVVQNSNTKITGEEGYAIIRLYGTFSSISFNYQAQENWCNFAFGADFQSCGDTDNDGIADYLDTDSDNDGCIDAIEGSLHFNLSQTQNGMLTGGVNSQGIPLVAGTGQGVGTSGSYIANCFCQPDIDITAPTVLTNDITVNLLSNGTASITASQIDNGSNDGCGIASITVAPNTFTCNSIGANIVTLTVTDVNSNVSTGTATVTVVDNILPTVSTQNTSVYLDANGNASVTVSQIDNGSSDNCGIATLTLDNMSFTCSNVGANTVTLTATDVNGNVNSATAVVTVVDQIIPTVLTQNATVYLDATGQASVSVSMIDNGSFDNCGIATLSLDNLSFSCSNVGANTVTLTATDVNGNVNSATAVVSVVDQILPTVLTQNATVYLDAAGQASITVSMIDNASFDNCGIATLSLDNLSFTCSNVGANTVTLTATDVNGNVNSATAVVSVVDQILPTVLTQNATVYLDAAGQASITVSMIDNASFDNCGIASLTLDNMSFTCSNVGANTVTLTATDVNGNVNSATAVVNVVDNVAPFALCQNVTVTLVGGSASITPQMIDNGSNDACGIQSISVSPNTFDCSDIGANTVVLTVTDNNNNVSTCSAFVEVIGVVPSCEIDVTLANNTYTGGDGKTIFLGYGPQSLTATVTATGGGPFTYNWTGGNGFLGSTTSSNPVFMPTTAGLFTLTCTVTNSYGCETTCDVTICVLDIRAGGNGNNAKVYICHAPPGNPNNAKTLKVSVNAVPAHLGNHAGDKLGSCNQSCGNATAKGSSPEFEEHDDHDAELSVYPNPTNASFNFILMSHSEEEVSISIYDVSGRLLIKLDNFMPNDETSFGDDLPTGVFFVKVIQGDFVKTVKVVKI